jgi:hypothetical protein
VKLQEVGESTPSTEPLSVQEPKLSICVGIRMIYGVGSEGWRNWGMNLSDGKVGFGLVLCNILLNAELNFRFKRVNIIECRT